MLAPSLRLMLQGTGMDWSGIEEIRLRAGQPLSVTWKGRSLFVSSRGVLQERNGQPSLEMIRTVTLEEVGQTMDLLSSYSRYAFEDKIRQGFLTVRGGHRVGLAGRVILEQGEISGKVKTISPVTCINIRVAKEVIGCGQTILPYLWKTDRELLGDGEEGSEKESLKEPMGETWKRRIYDTLLVSPPGVGKTTLLRDLIRLLSYEGMTVGVVDERSELAACWQGVAQHDLGPGTDVLDGCPKVSGMMMLIRAMAPQIIAVDEIGEEADHKALECIMCSGCGIMATAHGSSFEELGRRPVLSRWLKEERFGRYVFMEKSKTVEGIVYRYRVCDGAGNLVTIVERKVP